MKHILIGLVGRDCIGKAHLYSVKALPLSLPSNRRRLAWSASKRKGATLC